MKRIALEEKTECTWQILEEEELSEKGKIVKPMKIAGIASKGNMVNENGRHYKTGLFERESRRLQDAVSKGSFVGELDHPQDGKARLEKNAIRYTKLFMDGDYLKFEGNVLDTFAGKDLKANIRGKVAVDVSTRGFGSSKKVKINGLMVDDIQDDYELTGIDAVSGHSNLEAEINYFKEKKTDLREGGSDMKLDELKLKYPELVAQIIKEAEDRKAVEVTDKLTKDFEDKILDEIAKTRTDMTEEITASVKEELLPEHEESQAKLSEIADILGDLFEGAGKEKKPDEKDEELKDLKDQLTESNKKIDEIGKELKEAKGKIDKGDVKDYLDEVLKNEPFKVVLKERLACCLTKEEVDSQLPKEKDYVQKIVQENKSPNGKGKVLNEDEKDKNEKTALDETIKKQRRLAGLPETPVKADDKKE